MDLSEFLTPFFEECDEMLQQMESDLLALDSGDMSALPERIGSIFRVAHSIKGGAGTFGFTRITEYTHQLETLLDAIRAGEREMTPETVRVLLEAVDVLRSMLNAERDGVQPDWNAVQASLDKIKRIKDGKPDSVKAPTTDFEPGPHVDDRAPGGDQTQTPPEPSQEPSDTVLQPSRGWHIRFHPRGDLTAQVADPLRLLRELDGLGKMTPRVLVADLPPLHTLNPRQSYLTWDIDLVGDIPREQVEDIFAWVMDQADLVIEPLAHVPGPSVHSGHEAEGHASTPPSPLVESGDEAEDVVEGMAPGDRAACTPFPSMQGGETTLAAADYPQGDASAEDGLHSAKMEPPSPPAGKSSTAPQPGGVRTAPPLAPAKSPSAPRDGGSIRVGIEKVDAIIDLVGELVITQSMLGQFSEEVEREGFNPAMLERLRDGLSQLERNTRELQENIMRIRMLPISVAFNRFPRMVHDLSRQLGKQVELVITGENTELDKTVLEKIGDPLVHLVRNALDHGLEPPEERRAAGKPETGTLRLNAYHKGGNIVIEIGEDGRGINRAKVLAKARSLGLVGVNEQLSDDGVVDLIFRPGFSTAAQVTDISGRGVGMDVVKSNIQALGGHMDVRSEEGHGTTFIIRLPLTLSIMDGQLIGVGEHIYILPLMSIVESLQINPACVSWVAGRTEVYRLRESYIPIIRLSEIFGIRPREGNDRPLLVVIEAEGQRVALMIDELLAQQQVVIKSLETNFRRVEGLSGSTILGDGSVALILDVAGLLQISRRRESSKREQA